MILCEWDAPEGHPGQGCVHLYARILSTSFTSVSIFSVWCSSSVSQWYYSTVQYKHSHHFRLADTLTGPDNDKHYQLYTIYVFLVSESN
jgi:hypothetical protein